MCVFLFFRLFRLFFACKLFFSSSSFMFFSIITKNTSQNLISSYIMSLWVDKYRPIELNQCEHVNASVANHLKELVKDGDCPHCASFYSLLLGNFKLSFSFACFSNSLFLFLFLFLSRARFFLKVALFFTSIRVEIALFRHTHDLLLFSLFCSVVLRSVGFWEEIARPRALEHNLWPRRSQDKSRTENVENRPTSTRKIEVDLMTQSSNYHIEINPSDAGYKDRYVVQEVIKEMARSRPIDAQGNAGYKILVLTECDKLSKEAQHGLRRTMEKYSSACRLILIADSVNRVLEAVRSRCLPVRVAAPRAEDIEKVLYDIAAKEKLTLPHSSVQKSPSLRNAICVGLFWHWRRVELLIIHSKKRSPCKRRIGSCTSPKSRLKF